MERLQIIDCFGESTFTCHLKNRRRDPIGQKIRDRKAVLLDRLDLFFNVEVSRRSGPHPRLRRRPAQRSSADRTCQDRSDRGLLEIEFPERRSLPIPIACKSPLTVSGMRPFIAAIAAAKRSCCFSQPLCQYGFGLAAVSLPSRVEDIGIPLHPLSRAPTHGTAGSVYQMSDIRRRRARQSQRSASGSMYTALGPASVHVRRTS